MLTTNLLTSEGKKEIKTEEIRRVIIFFARLLSIILFISSSLLLPSYLPLIIQRRGLENSLSIEEEASTRFEVKKKMNSIRGVIFGISSIKSYAASSAGASKLLEEFLINSDSGVSITFLNIKKSGEFSLIGKAAARRDLLRFEETLRASNKFEDLSSPLSNIIRETNINFSLEGKLKPAHRF